MDFEQRMEEALSQVYAAMGESKVEQLIKSITGQLSLENMEILDAKIEHHYSDNSFTFKSPK